MAKVIPYVFAAIIGLFLRTIVAHMIGMQYAIDGHDIVVATACVTAVWGFKGVFLDNRPNKKRRNNR